MVFCCWPLTAIPAIVCGHVAWGDIRRNAQLRGKFPATVGMILGYAGLILSFLFAAWLVMQAMFLYQTGKEFYEKWTNVSTLGQAGLALLNPQNNRVHVDTVKQEPENQLPPFANVMILGILQPYTKEHPLLLPEKKDENPPLKAMKIWVEGQEVVTLEDGATDPVRKSPNELDPALLLRVMETVTASAGNDPNQEMIKQLLQQLQQLQPHQ